MLICFDMDGVLVDACDLHKRALECAMLEELGYTISNEDHVAKFNGLPTKKKLEALGIPKDQIEVINSKKQSYTLALIDKSIYFDKSKVDLLLDLKSSGYKVACVTNSIRLTSEIILGKVGVLSLLDLLVTNQDVKNPKPSPEPYLKAMELLKEFPGTTMIVEDSPIGIQSALMSGAKVIKVSNSLEVTKENILGQLCKY